MDKLSIETPEQTQVEFSVAGVGSRFLAFFFDSLIQFLVLMVVYIGLAVGLITTSSLWAGYGPWVVAAFALFMFSVYAGYFAFFEILWNGQTPGKRQFGIRVIQDDGRPLSPASAITRNLLRAVDYLPFGYAAGIICMLLNSRSKRLGDYVAGTVVVHEQSVESVAMPDDSLSPSAPVAQVVQLRPEEVRVIEAFFDRAPSLEPGLRSATAEELAAKMSTRLGLPLPGGKDPEEFLRGLLAAHRPAIPTH